MRWTVCEFVLNPGFGEVTSLCCQLRQQLVRFPFAGHHNLPQARPRESPAVLLEVRCHQRLGDVAAQLLDEQVPLQAGLEVLDGQALPLQPAVRLRRAGQAVPASELVGGSLQFLVRDG
jgi:hypothetical protein